MVRNGPLGNRGFVAFVVVVLWTSSCELVAQEVTIEDYQKLRINEILAQNRTTPPQNCLCQHVDMVELYNGSDKTLPLDGPLGVIRLSDRSTLPLCADPASNPDCLFITNYFSFRGNFVQQLRPGQRLVIFCDGPISCEAAADGAQDCNRDLDGSRETHANFGLSGGGECLLLEIKATGEDAVVLHEVTFPGLRDDVSYARFPEDAENIDGFVFNRVPTFGACHAAPQGGLGGPHCEGAANGPRDSLEPGIERIDFSTNNPAAGEPVQFRVRITDDAEPTVANLASVELRYRVDGGMEQVVAMTFLDLVDESTVPPVPVNNLPTCPSIDRWSIWEGAIPGQAAGSVVHFSFHVMDGEGLEGSDPGQPFCEFPVGPCDALDPTGPGPDCPDAIDCSASFRYTVESTYDGPLVLNELVASNDSVLEDTTDPVCSVDNVNCAFDDFIELCNNSADQTVELAGLILTDRPFRPERGWTFRPESKTLAPGERLLVWVDNDDEDPRIPGDPDNPNDAAAGAHHTNFGVNRVRDEIYILSEPDGEYAVLDGIRWGKSGRYTGSSVDPLSFDPRDGVTELVGRDQSLSRVPDCDRSSPIRFAPATPLEPNGEIEEGLFRRGDANDSSLSDISDALFILEFMFIGGKSPGCLDGLDVDDNGAIDINDPLRLLGHLFLGDPVPAPGAQTCGPDPTDDALPSCVYEKCDI